TRTSATTCASAFGTSSFVRTCSQNHLSVSSRIRGCSKIAHHLGTMNEPFSYKLALQTRVLATSPPGKSSPSGNVYPVRDNCPSKETPRRDPCAPEGHLARLPSVRHLDHVRGRPARGTGHVGSSAFGPVNKYLNLSGGDAMVVIPLSGITLRSFTGNLSVALQVALVTGYGFWTYVLEWQGIYAIPDPTYFQTVPTVDVTVRVTGPPSAVFNANLEFWNASNAFEASIEVPVGIDVRLSLPQVDYVVLAWIFDPVTTWEGLLPVHLPTSGTVGISTSPA